MSDSKHSNCLSFQGGAFTIRLSGHLKNGSGYFSVKDDDLDWDDDYRSAEIPASEFIEIRDWLNKVIPPAPALPATDEVEEAFDMARQLIQEAKGADGPNGGFVTDCLDDAENWLDKAQALAALKRTRELERQKP